MKSFIAAASLLALAFANPVIVENEPVNVVQNYSGIDLTMTATISQYNCLKSAGYSAVFISTYSTYGSGHFDGGAPINYFNAFHVGLRTEFFITPVPGSIKNASTQFNEVYDGFKQQGVTLKNIWIQVTTPINWSTNVVTNINFINLLRAAAKGKGLEVGIYTNFYDWNEITGYGNYNTPAAAGEPLWYWNVLGEGSDAETKPDFTDYGNFGGWEKPAVKQYGQAESACNVSFNRNFYPSTTFNGRI